MGKWTDKSYITRKEWSHGFGGGVTATKNKSKPNQKYQNHSFDLCSLTLSPFSSPVCDPEGTIFDLEAILPLLQKTQKNPLSGKEMKISDLTRLVFHKNKAGQYYCPITLKVFTDYSHIVTNRKSGNVYSYDAHISINPPGSLIIRDPISDEIIQKEDLIVLQDPNSTKITKCASKTNNDEISKLNYQNPISVTSTASVPDCKLSKNEINSCQMILSLQSSLGAFQIELYNRSQLKNAVQVELFKELFVDRIIPNTLVEFSRNPFCFDLCKELSSEKRVEKFSLCFYTEKNKIFIALSSNLHLKDKYVVIGRIAEGNFLSKLSIIPADSKTQKPLQKISISSCQIASNSLSTLNTTVNEYKLPSAFDYY